MSGKTIRVPDDVWERAMERAKDEGSTLSDLIRQWLATYAGFEPDHGVRRVRRKS